MVKLDEQQVAAINTDAARILVLSAPGAGKTTVLVARLARILEQDRILPSSVACITFTRYAAHSMKERVAELSARASGCFIGTFHAFALRQVMENASVLGLERDWLTIMDEFEAGLEEREVLDDFRITSDPAKVKAWKKFYGQVASGAVKRGGADPMGLWAVQDALTGRLLAENVLTFGMIVQMALRLFEDPEVGPRLRGRYRHFLVDECFPAGTPILTSEGWVAIDTIVNGGRRNWIVAAQDTDGVVWAHVKTAYKTRRRGPLVRVDHEYGALYPTADHPFMVGGERVPAINLRSGTPLSLVQKGTHASRNAQAPEKDDGGSDVQQRAPSVASELHVGGEGEENSFSRSQADWTQASHPRGKRKADASGSVRIALPVGEPLARRVCCPYWRAAEGRPTKPLQSRHRAPSQEDSDRGRRAFAQHTETASRRSAEDLVVTESRVEGVEILEQGSSELAQFRDGADFVYTLGVDHPSHTYIAAGIIVGNCQDTDTLQWDFIEAFRPETLFSVADTDQTLYSFRGARPDIVIQMANDPTVKVLPLNNCYRFGPAMTVMANRLIAHNVNRIPKEMVSVQATGVTRIARNMKVSELCDDIQAQTCAPQEIAVLARMHSVLDLVHDELEARGVKVCRTGVGARLEKSPEYRTVRGYMTLAVNPASRRAFMAVAHAEGFTAEDLLRWRRRMLDEGISLVEASGRPHLRDVGADLTALRLHLDAVDRQTDYSEVIAWLTEIQYTEGFTNMQDLLNYLAMRNVQDDLKRNADGIVLATGHASKGLEWPVVYVVGLNEGVFPSSRALKEGAIEEERCIAYVAITRARKELVMAHLSFPQQHRTLGKRTDISRFIGEATGSVM